MNKETLSNEHRNVRCWVGGSEYLVGLGRGGEVESVIRYVWTRHSVYKRQVWSIFDGKPIPPSAQRAGKAAVRKSQEAQMRVAYSLIPTRYAESFVAQPTHYSIGAEYYFRPGSIQHEVYGPVRCTEVEHDLPAAVAHAKIRELRARG